MPKTSPAGRADRQRLVSRRRLMQTAGGLMALGAVPGAVARAAAAAPQSAGKEASADITGRFARYMAEARTRPLPPDVLQDTKHRILDSLAAIVSGAKLHPGEMAIAFVRTQGGVPEASVLTTDIRTSAINAALANGMCAHADETDDVEPITKTHPGSAVIPAALAIAERDGRSGSEFLRAVALGYDACIRCLLALGPDLVRGAHRGAEGTGATFGATAAASSLARLDERQMRFAISYAAQQTSGLWSWVGDVDHVEKAFDFSGMGARNGVTAALMVQAGFTGVADVLDGEHNMLIALSSRPTPEALVADLGKRFCVTEAAIKLFSVGYPIQAPLDALLTLRREHRLTPDNVEYIRVSLPTDGAGIVNDSAMPDVNCQYILAVGLQDGTVSFENSHSQARMKDPAIRAIKSRIELIADRSLMIPDAPRSGRVEVRLRGGRTVSHYTRHPPGSKENPASTEQINAKARDLMTPVLGASRTESLIQRIQGLDSVANMRELRPLLTV